MNNSNLRIRIARLEAQLHESQQQTAKALTLVAKVLKNHDERLQAVKIGRN